MSNQDLLSTFSRDKWSRVGTQRRAGILAPLFSVYSKNSFGIGDFQDLKLLVDFCNQTGHSIIQLLPMNEVGPLFCPYDSVSAFALEPSYIVLNRIAPINEKFPSSKTRVDYRIKEKKIELLRKIFDQGINRSSGELEKFKNDFAYWLGDFALFKALKNYHQGKAWFDWDERYRYRDKEELDNFSREHQEEIDFEIWMQWQLYEQFLDAKRYAESKKVLIKGDLPILVSRDSADVWSHPEFFKLELASGAPPDMYCAKGQRWGMPTNNWTQIEGDGYRYIKEKLKYAENFYDLLRIDHVVGLFRIWSIPYDDPLENQGLNGFFDPKDENIWGDQGRKILSVIVNNTRMLICAEDLGTIPKACPKTLVEFGIPGNDVQRWIKEWKVKHDFLRPQDYRFLSVAMLSTHDTTNWPAWWENEAGTIDEALFIRKCAERKIDYALVKDKLFDSSRSRHGRLRWLDSVNSTDLFVRILGKRKEELADFIDMYENSFQEKEKLWQHLKIKGPMREESDAEIVRQALRISLESSAVFCINTLIDWLYLTDIFQGDSYQYRTNTPGTISDKNWSLTIPISLEELLKHKVNKDIRAMITTSGRI